MAAEPAKAEGDEARLEAALDALVENAVKFTVDGDTVALRCRAVRGHVVVEVQDSGIGFARSRLDDGSSPPEASGRPGTGLGLAIVRAVAEGHGGTLSIDEQRPVGSLLRIELPTRRSVVEPGLSRRDHRRPRSAAHVVAQLTRQRRCGVPARRAPVVAHVL